ncbi:N-acetylmannosamine-6-phosphate 2-epimerase [Alkalihalobacillus sp. AL-G]|uniref:N-acetylmannosamine-6-phosphate 2-epimerase n=1 Tax=Alkalihalobacillus sp. AL-G TaxID=2926399 RepID=UPI00272D216A|nr:N-acetylmannosamine-6-phosphate 2-epimerase [Alkalihalobacillus sp. AL-G]WLD93073.1 N-acetylmannosamine-6-phosphate 2-epimerase [Alkalihalobacillus sp. AL-G]
MNKTDLFRKLEGALIVSCQALEDEPLHGAETMAKMALAAEIGGASAIRANGGSDIEEIQKVTRIPIIGLIKKVYPDSNVYITPSKTEVDLLIDTGVNMVALDGTTRHRPDGVSLKELLHYLKAKGQIVMADISTFEEGVLAEQMGFDCVSTTLSGYTPYSRQNDGPDFELIERLATRLRIPVIAEGKIHSPEQAKYALGLGAYAVVVGSAITRPQEITKRYVNYLKKDDQNGEQPVNYKGKIKRVD